MSEAKIVRITCSPHCANVCGISAYVKDGRLIKIEPANYGDSRYSRICVKGLSEIQRVYHPDRLRYPLKRIGNRGEGKWQRISWDEAISTIAAKLTDIQKKHGSRAVAFVKGGHWGWVH